MMWRRLRDSRPERDRRVRRAERANLKLFERNGELLERAELAERRADLFFELLEKVTTDQIDGLRVLRGILVPGNTEPGGLP